MKSSFAESLDRANRVAWSTVWYRTTVAVLAAGLLFLPWCRTTKPSGALSHSAVVSSEMEDADGVDHVHQVVQAVVADSLSPASISAIARTYPHVAEIETSIVAADQATKPQLHNQVHLQDTKIHIDLEFRGSQSEAGATLLREVMRNIVVGVGRWKSDKLDEVHLSVDPELIQKQDKLNAIADELAELKSAPPKNNFATQPPRPNQAWHDLNDELQGNRRELNSLLETRTEEHPNVVRLQYRIDLLSKQLKQTEQYLEPIDPQADQAYRQALAAHQQKIETLETQHATLSEYLIAQNPRQADAQKALNFVKGIRIETGPPISAQPTTTGAWNYASLLLVAAIVAGLAATAYGLAIAAAGPKTLSSLAKLKSLSRTPIVATIPRQTTDPVNRWWAPLRNGSFLLTRGSEFALLAIVVVGVLAWQFQPDFGVQLVADPAMAMHHAWSSINVK